MSYHGDIRLGDTIDVKFSTRNTSGAPTTLAGTPAISAYVGNSITQITAGITLTVDFDGVTGLHNVRVVATSGNGFATATNISLVITTGTVGGTSVVGEQIGSFSIENRSAVMPTVAARTLDVSAGGEAGVDWANVGSPTTAVSLSATTVATVTTTTTATNVTTVNGLAANVITAASIATDAIDSDAIAASAVTEIQSGLATPTNITAATGITVSAIGAGVITATSIAADAITDAKVASDVTIASVTGSVGSVTGAVGSVTGTVGSVTGNVGGNVVGSVASVVGAVGSVTGNVGGNVTGSIGSLGATAKSDVNTEVLDVLATDTFAEASSVPAATSSLKDKINWLFALARNKITQTATTQLVRNDADSGTIGTSTVSDDGTTFTRGEYS